MTLGSLCTWADVLVALVFRSRELGQQFGSCGWCQYGIMAVCARSEDRHHGLIQNSGAACTIRPIATSLNASSAPGTWLHWMRTFGTAGDAAPHEIVECDGLPVGYMCVEDRRNLVHVRELVLLPQFQNRGIGTAMLRQVQAHAEGRGVTLRLQTLHANRVAALYRRVGFREIGRTETHILFEWLPPAHC
jgi:ribosomal protein S18 acetylase RimI-like enzyme